MKHDYLNLIKLINNIFYRHFNFVPKIGVEIEFYLNSFNTNYEINLNVFEKKFPLLKKERGLNQFEYVFLYTDDLEKLVKEIIDFKSQITNFCLNLNINVNFEAKPFDNDYGSALHFHLSLHEINDQNINLFSQFLRNGNNLMQFVIGGILDISLESQYLLNTNDTDYKRFVPKFLAPTKVCWGNNNRTTLLRIPQSTNLNKRIEFRLSSANSAPDIGIFIILLGALNGIRNQIDPSKCVYGNADDEHYNFTNLANNLNEAKLNYHKGGKIDKYIKELLVSKND